MITSSVKALRNNRKWAIGLKKSPLMQSLKHRFRVLSTDAPKIEPKIDPIEKIDLFTFSTQNAYQNEISENSDQVLLCLTSRF